MLRKKLNLRSWEHLTRAYLYIIVSRERISQLSVEHYRDFNIKGLQGDSESDARYTLFYTTINKIFTHSEIEYSNVGAPEDPARSSLPKEGLALDLVKITIQL